MFYTTINHLNNALNEHPHKGGKLCVSCLGKKFRNLNLGIFYLMVPVSVTLTYHWRELPQVSFLSQQNTSFVATKACSNICCDKHNFVTTNTCLSQPIFVITKVVSQTQCCHDKSCVTAGILLSHQKTCFVATKMILVATPSNDRPSLKVPRICRERVLFCPFS